MKTCIPVTVGIIGIIIAVVGGAFVHFFPVIFDKILKEQTRLVKGNMGYDNWKDPPAEIYMDFYVWNLENPLEVEKGAKPNVTQKGPYTYREYRPKVNIETHDNGTLSYIQPQSFVFDLDRSVGDATTDTFTTLNMPLLTVIDQLQFMPENMEYLFDIIATLLEKHIHSTHTVHEFIWGYFSPLLFLARIAEPEKVPFDYFGIFYGRNTSNDGIYNVFDGVQNYKKTNNIDRWRGMDLLPYWTTKYGNMLNGTDGTYFGQLFKKEDTVYVFSSDICRSIYATYEKDTTTRGIPTWRFTPPPIVFANHYKNPDNIAFCTPDAEHCYPGGLLNGSVCQYGAPIFFSSPHFLYADQEVFDMINGVHPVKELHETFLDLEPYSGGPLNVSKKIQINAHLRSYSYIEFYKHVPEAYLPLVWVDERGVATQAAANELHNKLFVPLAIGKYAPWSVFGFGLVILLLAVVCLGVSKRKRDGTPFLSANATEDERSPLM